jgi:hypothetical protein
VRCWRPGRPGRWTPSDYGRAVPESISPIFRVADGRVSAGWYARLGFTVTGEHRFAPDLPLYLFLDGNRLRVGGPGSAEPTA